MAAAGISISTGPAVKISAARTVFVRIEPRKHRAVERELRDIGDGTSSSPRGTDAVGLVVGDQDGVVGDDQAVDLTGDGDAALRPRAAIRPTIGTSARLPGAKISANSASSRIARALAARSRSARPRRNPRRRWRDSARRRPCGAPAEYRATIASADARCGRDPAPVWRSIAAAPAARLRPISSSKADDGDSGAARGASAGAGCRSQGGSSRRCGFCGRRARRCASRRPPRHQSCDSARLSRRRRLPRPGTDRAARATRSYQQPSGRFRSPSAPQTISRSAARVMAT